MQLLSFNHSFVFVIIIIIIINIYIAPILFSAKRFTMLQNVLDKNKNPKIIYEQEVTLKSI